MEYFDRVPESRGSGNSKSQRVIDKDSMNEEAKEAAMLNQNSSTAMGTNQHGQSLQIDIEGNLAHNQSLDMQDKLSQKSPGMRSKRSGVRDTIPEEEPDSGAASRFSKKTVTKGIISGQGLRSNQTLAQGGEQDYGSEATSQVPSPSLKSLMKAKHGGLDPNSITNELKESMKQNQKKVKGTTSIKNLIRSAATRN